MNDAFEYAHHQSRRIGEVIEDNEAIVEAISNSFGWAEIAYNQLIEHDLPALYAASTIVGAINSCLMNRVMQPPSLPESDA